MAHYRPQLFLRTADITVSLTCPDGTSDANEKMVMPGDNVEMVCELVHDVAAEIGTRFTLREGGKTSEQLVFYLDPITDTLSSWHGNCDEDLRVNVIRKILHAFV